MMCVRFLRLRLLTNILTWRTPLEKVSRTSRIRSKGTFSPNSKTLFFQRLLSKPKRRHSWHTWMIVRQSSNLELIPRMKTLTSSGSLLMCIGSLAPVPLNDAAAGPILESKEETYLEKRGHQINKLGATGHVSRGLKMA